MTPWTAACQASLSFTNFQSLLKIMSIELVMPSNHLILYKSHNFFLINSIFLSLNTSVSTNFKIKVVFQKNLGSLFSYQHLYYLTVITYKMCLSPLSFSSTYNSHYRREKVEAVTDFYLPGFKITEDSN